jgi:hypothetical protein
VHDQTGTGKRLVHLVNFSGHQDRSFHDPLEIRDIQLQIAAPASATIRRARALFSGRDLPLQTGADGWVSMTIPSLGLLEAISLEP